MKKFAWGFLIACLIYSLAEAKTIPRPPKSDKIPVIEQNYLKQIYDNLNKLEIVTTNPDGSRKGNYGDIVGLYTGGNYYLEMCVSTPNGTVWRGTQLTDTP